MALELSGDLFSQTGPFKNCPWNTLNKLALTRECSGCSTNPLRVNWLQTQTPERVPSRAGTGIVSATSLWSEAHAKVNAPS